MQLLDELINNPQKYNDLIAKQSVSLTKNINSTTLFASSFAYSTMALGIQDLYAIEKSKRIVFFKKCMYANRYSIGLLLKKGRESYEKEVKTEAIKTISFSEEKEIQQINSFLNASEDSASFKAINNIVSRGMVHILDMITEQDFKQVVHDELFIDYDIELNYAAIKNDVIKSFHEFDFSLDSKRTRQCLQYFQCATPIEDIDYQCFYKPFFMALQDYSNHLKTRASINYENENTAYSFVVAEDDFREGYSGRLSYEDIIANKEFHYMEEVLFEDGIIDTEYNFIEKRGNKKALAAIIKFMVYERYFKKSNYKHPQKFELYHYRQYLDHRYGTNTAETMKKMSDKEVKLYFNSIRWKYDLNKLINTDFFGLNTL